MSIESARRYIEKIQSDEAFWRMHKNARDRSDREKLMESNGFTFTDDELLRVLDKMTKGLSRELNTRRTNTNTVQQVA